MKLLTQWEKRLKIRQNKIEELEKANAELSKVRKDKGIFSGKLDEKQLWSEIKDLLKENDDLRAFANEANSELEYGKQRENKLMYFLFLLQQKDYPVFDVFEKYIKDLDTQRFSTELDEDYKHIYIQQMRKLKELGFLEREWYKSDRGKKVKGIENSSDYSLQDN